MAPNVLIVQDGSRLLLSMMQAVENQRERFTVIPAASGREAREQLRRQPVSAVAADLTALRLDGFDLLTHLREHYPDVPVIVLTDPAEPDAERTVRHQGVATCVPKTAGAADLVAEILRTLDRQSDGGTLRGVSSGIFLQLLRMERRTCTIRITAADGRSDGALFVAEGELVDARAGGLRGEPAAHEILGWRDVSLTIQNSCTLPHRARISSSLDALLLETMRRRDEAAAGPAAGATPRADAPADPVSRLRLRLEQGLGPKSGVSDIYADPAALEAMAALRELGARLGLGEPLAARLCKDTVTDKVVLPTVPPTVVEVSRSAPGARLLEIVTAP